MYEDNHDHDYEDYDSDFDDYDHDEFDCDFQDPGGNSALRRETPDNPRIYPCPTCGMQNTLTTKDVALGYQCDQCANRDEGYGF